MFRSKKVKEKNSLEHVKIGKHKKWVIGVLCLVLCGLTVGFATFYNELIISPFAIVKPNFGTFRVLFSNTSNTTDTSGVIPSVIGSAKASSAAISNEGYSTVKRMNVVFSEPGQSVTYTFYARNVGEYDAFLTNVIFDNADSGDSFKVCTPVEGTNQEEVTQACNYIHFSVNIAETQTFEGTEKVTNHSLEMGKSEKIVVTISYDANDIIVNGDFTVDLGDITLVYSSVGSYDAEESDSTGETGANTLYNAILLNEAKTSSVRKARSYIAGKEKVSFSNQATTDEGLNLTQDEDGPAYYYRGAVDDNHVLFAGFCWRIIRTTGTGGVKLLYDGSPSNGVCNNTGSASYISNGQFNSSYNSPAYVGYRYGTTYRAYSKAMNTLSGNIVYGNDVTYNDETGEYTLVDPIESDVANWASEYTNVQKNHHYTCFTDKDTCTSVHYINHNNETTSYYFILTEGKKHTDILNEMLRDSTNHNNSTIKNSLDTWYKNNLLDYTNKLEDTVFCNDRSIYSYGGWDKDTGNNNWLYFGTYGRLGAKKQPSLVCPNFNDKFTVNLGVGNGDLMYPVGLITADEIAYAGGVLWQTNTKYYLYTGEWHMWSGSPYVFSDTGAHGFGLGSSGDFGSNSVYGSYGLRPSVSLKPGTIISGGNGNSESPYIVE